MTIQEYENRLKQMSINTAKTIESINAKIVMCAGHHVPLENLRIEILSSLTANEVEEVLKHFAPTEWDVKSRTLSLIDLFLGGLVNVEFIVTPKQLTHGQSNV